MDEALSVIHDKLQEDKTLEDRTTLSPDRDAELLGLTMTSTYFSYDEHFYKLQEDAAMGSPVSATVDNLCMEFFKNLTLESAPVRPRVWKQYVNDTCCIVKGTAEGLMDHLNSVRPTIQFTVELEKDRTLPFLNALFQRKDYGSLDVTSYVATESPRTLTSISTTSPTIYLVSRGVW